MISFRGLYDGGASRPLGSATDSSVSGSVFVSTVIAKESNDGRGGAGNNWGKLP